MSEPFTLAAMGAVALTEGIRFLYDQAGELLKKRRHAVPEDSELLADTEVGREEIELTLPAVFEDSGAEVSINHFLVRQIEPELRALRRDLQEYVSGIDPIRGDDAYFLQRFSQLRELLESVYGRQLRLVGEQPTLSGAVEVDSGARAGRDFSQRGRYVAGRDLTIGVEARQVKPDESGA